MNNRLSDWLSEHPFRLLAWALILTGWVFVIMAFAIAKAEADTVDLTWTAPTQREDGSTLTAAEIAGYRIAWTLNAAPQTDKVIPPSTAYTLDTGAQLGKVCLTLRTIDTDGLESVPTGEVCRKARPKPPGAMKVK